MIKQVIWSSMIDYPNHISTVLFFDKCNLNCPYCYNRELANMTSIDFDNDILPKLIERKEFISHVILSGGECTYNNDFEEVLNKLYDNGFTVGIHTNGSNPEMVSKNISKISFLGIDVKTTIDKYSELGNIDTDNVKETIKLALNNNKDFQCRTTLYPNIVNIDDCKQIAIDLKELGVKEYTIQQYYAVGSAKVMEPYTENEIKNIQTECNKIIHTNLKIK